MIAGLFALDKSGIAPSHLPAFQQVANSMNVWIMVRNVNKLCTSLIEHNFPTKGMSVHGKSSDWGPQAGLICKNQELSKFQGKPRVADLNKEIEHSLGSHGKGDVKAGPLVLGEWRLLELEQLGLIRKSGKTTFITLSHGRHSKAVEYICPNRPHTFLAAPTTTGGKDHLILVKLRGEGAGEPLEVIFRTKSLTDKGMTTTEGVLPLTADYDLFNVCPRWQDLDLAGADRFQNVRADLPEIGRFAVNHGKSGPYNAPKPLNFGAPVTRLVSTPTKTGYASTLNDDLKFGQGHGVKGHITARQNAVRQRLNSVINAGYQGGDTVHHGAETMNPFPEADDFGITIFRPMDMPLGLENMKDLSDSFWLAKSQGFYFHTNPLWGWKPWGNDLTNGFAMRVSKNVVSVKH